MADGVRVETEGLDNFANRVQDDTTRTLESGYSRASVDLSGGVRFGAGNAGGGVHAAKARYAQSLQASTANIVAYMDAARILASAAAKVAVAFDSTDGTAAQRNAQVHDALTTAVAEAQQRRVEADGHPTTRGGGARAV